MTLNTSLDGIDKTYAKTQNAAVVKMRRGSCIGKAINNLSYHSIRHTGIGLAADSKYELSPMTVDSL